MGTLLDKMQKYTDLISKKYEIAKRDLTDSKKLLKDKPTKYVMYGFEYLPSHAVFPPEVSKLLASRPTVNQYDLKNELNFSCIYERNKPKKKPVVVPGPPAAEELKNEPAPESPLQPVLPQLAAALVEKEDIVQKNQELKADESKISYDQRILNWLNPEFVRGKDPHSILYHTFSYMIDPIIKKYGKESTCR